MDSPCKDHGKKGRANGYANTRHKGKSELLHRVVYCAAHGLDIIEIAGKVVRHRCDNPRCIADAHLLLGTHQDNMDDRTERRRHGRLKLTPEQIAEIRSTCVPNVNGDHSPNPLSYAALGRKFGVAPNAVRAAFLNINHRKDKDRD